MKKSKNVKRIKNRGAGRTILRRFFLKNAVIFTVMLIMYGIIFLVSMLSQDFYAAVFTVYFDYISPVLSIFMNLQAIEFLFTNHFCLYLICCFWVFIINSILQSVSTLINFDKTCRSLDAFTDSKKDIASFSKSYSDIEIKLKDIKLEVLESRNTAIEAENRKNDLVMYLAHDLKTPLTSVIGYLTLLYESPELTTEQKAKFSSIALDKAYRLEQLINEFFEITRFNINSVTLQKNRIDLSMMLHQITDEFYPMLSEKNIEVHTDIPERIIMLADSDKIARVFDNLLKNAVAYSYENTIIRIGARVKQNRVIIKFRNKCDEIPEEKLARLFDKFYRADASRNTLTGNSGLGLAIAKQITELHGGAIKASSTPDYTDFTVILPYINAEELTNEEFDF